MNASADILIVGGGLVGLSVARCCARLGLSVTLLERERVGSRASWAGAGMLTCHPWPKPPEGESDYHDLVLESIRIHEAWAGELRDETGIDVGFVRCGALELIGPERASPASQDNIRRMLDGCVQRGIRAERITLAEAARLEPNVRLDGYREAVHFPDDGQVRNNRLGRALAASCRNLGVRIVEGVDVSDLDVDAGAARGVVCRDGTRYAGGKLVVATGAWTPQIAKLVEAAPRAAKIEPVKGQMLCYQAPPGLCTRLLTAEHRYLVPRPDGVILAGSTMEYAGFSTVTTPEGLQSLRALAESLLPALKGLEPLSGWADVRPGLKGIHPMLGPVPGVEHLYMAAGHFRTGITLAPLTGLMMAEMLAGKAVPALAEPLLPKA
ncbi:MAG: glycine oxidase ThiO [Planctomycetota bacterium]|nr:glycine oxidase ThiO [Planctomycetota bacterium]